MVPGAGAVIRVVIADDNAVIRRGLASLLESLGGFSVVAQVDNGKHAVAAASTHRPDVVLLDVRMPVMNGVDAASQLAPATKVLMLTYSEDEWAVTGAIKAGALGYLVHGRFTPDELADAVRDVAAGKAVLSPAVATTVFGALRHGDADTGAPPFDVTEREFEIMQLVVRGQTNAEIGAALFISDKTVKNHLNRVYAKLGVSRRAEAIATWLGVVKDGA